jgi:hypothetical protein
MRVLLRAWAVFTVLTLASSWAAAQSTVYVDATSTCPGAGTIGNPYCRIQDAICAIRSTGGGTVMVKPGTYNEAVRHVLRGERGVYQRTARDHDQSHEPGAEAVHHVHLHGIDDDALRGGVLPQLLGRRRLDERRSAGGLHDHRRPRHQADV